MTAAFLFLSDSLFIGLFVYQTLCLSDALFIDTLFIDTLFIDTLFILVFLVLVFP